MPDYRRHRVPVRAAKGERGIWQRRYWEHTIRDEKNYTAGLRSARGLRPYQSGEARVACVRDWPHSSIHRCVAQGVYASDWAGQGVRDLPAGERGA